MLMLAKRGWILYYAQAVTYASTIVNNTIYGEKTTKAGKSTGRRR